MQTTIAVRIFNWNCLQQKSVMALDVGTGIGGSILIIKSSGNNPTQNWVLIPNLVNGAAAGGFTIYNPAADKSAEQPNAGNPILLGDDPTPFGSKSYCWTLWPAGTSDAGEQLWAIQDSQQGNAMDATDGNCDPEGVAVLLYGWNGGDNQKWVIRPISD